ncbi:MAG: hypothetical protein QXI73_02035 [Thermoproteota archaeon]
MKNKNKGSIFKYLTRREAEDILNAVKHDKYWKVDMENKDLIFVVALSRARVESRRGMYAKATYVKRVEVVKEAARFCRKWRVLLVDRRRMLAVSVLTWKTFNKIFSKGIGPLLSFMFSHDVLPPYINKYVLSKMLKYYNLEQVQSSPK